MLGIMWRTMFTGITTTPRVNTSDRTVTAAA